MMLRKKLTREKLTREKKGVQRKIKDQFPNASYVYCQSHFLNLVIFHSCADVPSIRDFVDNVGKITCFLGGSAKRKELFLATSDRDDANTCEIIREDGDNQISRSHHNIEKGAHVKTNRSYFRT